MTPLARGGERLSASRSPWTTNEDYELGDYVDLETLAVQFTCKDCEKEIERAPHHMDIQGFTPVRCATCVFERMSEP